jgi:hypothetical protein
VRRTVVDVVGGKDLVRYLSVAGIEESFDEPTSDGLVLFRDATEKVRAFASWPARLWRLSSRYGRPLFWDELFGAGFTTYDSSSSRNCS